MLTLSPSPNPSPDPIHDHNQVRPTLLSVTPLRRHLARGLEAAEGELRDVRRTEGSNRRLAGTRVPASQARSATHACEPCPGQAAASAASQVEAWRHYSVGMSAAAGDVILSGFASIYFERVLKSVEETYSVR